MNERLQEKIGKIRCLVMDVDGVLTDGTIRIGADGKEIKVFDVQDGFGIVLFQKVGYQTAIITARASEAVRARAADLKISHVYQDAHPKIQAYQDLKIKLNLEDDQICFIGDDLTDLKVMKTAGLAVTVPNAAREIKEIADIETVRAGGRGAVRELVEVILKTQGKWQDVLEMFA